jgi:hypothetical protein
MILHYAMLCAAAGGVDAFLIGSELRGLTTLRSAASAYPVRMQPLWRWRRGEGDPAGCQGVLCRRLVGVFRPPAAGRFGRRAFPSRSAVGLAPCRLHRHRQLHAADGLARWHQPCRCGWRDGARSTTPSYLAAELPVAKGMTGSTPPMRTACPAGANAHHRRRLWQALGVPSQGCEELVAQRPPQPPRRQ